MQPIIREKWAGLREGLPLVKTEAHLLRLSLEPSSCLLLHGIYRRLSLPCSRGSRHVWCLSVPLRHVLCELRAVPASFPTSPGT